MTRILIVRRGCPHCRQFLSVIIWFNLRLPLNKQIKIFDNFKWEEFGYREHPIMEKLEKDGFDAYPYLYLDGIVVNPSQKELIKPFLSEYLTKELLH